MVPSLDLAQISLSFAEKGPICVVRAEMGLAHIHAVRQGKVGDFTAPGSLSWALIAVSGP